MAIQDDFTIDYVLRRITYTTAFDDDRPPDIYTVNELYSWLQDTFDEPDQMDDPIPMSAQTPTQYTMINGWFIDDNSIKALYGGSIQTADWTRVASPAAGITQIRWDAAGDAPTATDIGELCTGVSGATGFLLAVDATRQVAWLRNNNGTQFADADAITSASTAFTSHATNGFQTGECKWPNLFSVGSLQSQTEIYVGQEDDYQGGRAYQGANPEQLRREKIDEWWDSDVDFFTGSPNLLGGPGHFDILVKTHEADVDIDGQRLAVFARQFSKVYSHFELIGGVGNFVVPFASTGADLNASYGPYEVAYSSQTGDVPVVGDVLINDAGEAIPSRLRAVITASDEGAGTGNIEYYLIGENEALTTYDRTLNQLNNGEGLDVLGTSTCNFDAGTPAEVTDGPAQAQGVTVTFSSTQVDVDEDTTDEEYACTVDCNDVPLAEVYRYLMFLCSRGNQDGSTPDTQDTLLQTSIPATDEASEFYRGVGDISFLYDGGQGSFVSEGDYVTNVGVTASGVVVSVTAGATGVIVLTQVKGTFSDGEQVARPAEHATNRVDLNGDPTTLVDNTAAPFGTFAGGRWFVAQGIVLTNVPTADNNNWQTVSLGGDVKAPPTTILITFSGLVANDRAVIFEVATAGEDDIVKDQNGIGAIAAISDVALVLDTSIALDVPLTGWVRVVDTSEAASGTEYRYEYSGIVGVNVTLLQHADLSGTGEAGGSTTRVVETGKFDNYGTGTGVKTGMLIRETGGGGWAKVLRWVSNDEIETTPISAGTWASNNWEANQVVVALATDDDCYFGFIDDEAISTSLSKSVKYAGSATELIARARFSDPDVGGTRILPFVRKDFQLVNADLVVAAIRTTDTIASV